MKNNFCLVLLLFSLLCSSAYAENICSSTSSSADSGTFYDSGGSGSNYSNNEDCGFLIQPASSASITLSFSQFDLENGWDYLYVYDGTSTSGIFLGRFTGTSLPSDLTATSGSMYLRFDSDFSITRSGFTASWTSSNSTSICSSVADDFSSLSYSNNDGSDNWTNSWQEVGESDGVSAGKARVRSDLCSSGNCLRLGTPSEVSPSAYSGRGASRAVDLNGATSATLTFNYYTGVNSGSSTVILAVSDNGGSSWTTLKTYTINSTNFSANPESFDLSAFASSNTQIRFLGSGSSSSVTGMYIDDINIDYCKPSGGSGSCVTFRDEFSTASYSRQDGTANWSENWDEYEGTSATTPETSVNPASGHVRIVGGQLILDNYSPESQNFPGVERQLDLSAYSSATFTFEFETTGNVDTEDSIVIMASANGGTNWAELEDIRGINDTSGSKSYDLTPYISSNTKIRIRFNNETDSGLGSNCCYGGSPETFSVDDVQIEACGSGGGGGDTVATNFNCVENGLDGIIGKLYTKAVNQTFALDIIALQDASTIETSFANGTDHTVTVELVDARSGSCSSYSSLNPAVSQNVVFTASDAGNKSSASMSSASAYSNVKCRVTDITNTPAVVGCSTDSFAIRPTGFSVTSNMTNSTATGTPTAKAGDNFTLTATASTGYDGTPQIDSSKVEAHFGAVQTGTISGSFGSANSSNGQATGNAFTYSEVGSLRFAAQGIYDDNFTAIDQSDDCTNDFSNTPVGGKIGCKFANSSASNYFGRFTPDHFDVNLNTPGFSPACGNFTYVGQPVKYTTQPIVTVTAKNSAGTTTQNYTGSFWKIVPTDSTYGIIPSYSEASHGLSVLDSNSPTVTDNGNGSGILTFADTSNNILGISRGNPEVEFDAEIAMTFNLSDTDGITVSNVNGSPQTNPISFGAASAGNGISFGGNKTQRWGRIALTNAHGSELSVLPVPLQTEYFNGTDFIPSSSDNCTTINLSSQISLSNPVTSGGVPQAGNTAMTIGSGTSTATLLNSPVSSGSSSLNFSAPGAGNTGYIDISSNFSSFPWILFDWDNDSSHDNSPSGKATFGVFSGSPEQIYFREVY